ncbi:UDP-N-acetylglucosamine 2-epimerase (hydrolyzing) [Tumebacillus algifaecis]|uniref:UDP-N-acetylglucosamine 2-epimerase (Hydrolyzing) n=1 Tax=Tumebacillus algifaecis TaxID=1214604 RepID=A0A223CXM6_9BACL|nr:UDP-N-acetylglucosamine 2-epimerase [Tumebacillus algifaecis]ASS73947.1 UDP-N-acetylglucosamine 2-epimerase (hydrolyzing) [Tumebacillus algifaecis]
MTKRKICVVTGTRAEYGLLYWLMKEIEHDPDLQLQIIVSGMHLSPEFGLTYKGIEADGFTIDEKVEMLLSSDTPVGIAKSIGLATIGFADALDRLRPDILVVLGDRFEILAAVQAALVARIPVAHLHGGEATEGLIDEGIRHAVTKMAHLHFTAAEPYRQRVIQLGEAPERVFNFGAPGVDNIVRLPLLSRDAFQDSIGFELGLVNFLVTYHPVTLRQGGAEAAMTELLTALDRFPEAKILFTKPNSDTDGRIIGQLIDEYAAKRGDRVFVTTSLGQLRYLSAIQHCDAVIGNSSSGLIEVPVFQKPTINIGERQRGRLKPDSVIDCDESAEAIEAAVGTALSPQFQDHLRTVESPFGTGQASQQIKEQLKRADLDGILMKKFYEVTPR